MRRATCPYHHVQSDPRSTWEVSAISIVAGLVAAFLNAFALGMLWSLPHPIRIPLQLANFMTALGMVGTGCAMLYGTFGRHLYNVKIATATTTMVYGIYLLAQYNAGGNCAVMMILLLRYQCSQDCGVSCDGDLTIFITQVFVIVQSIHIAIGATWFIVCYSNYPGRSDASGQCTRKKTDNRENDDETALRNAGNERRV
ncbi:uncharacterized protein LOC129601775 isoform X2 [Paramacrobiotus metropolitanus]|uniref:uncharacterized protein LOC129601775 isoform X2 n=1 Tax=Paramacrobiotus metropolitanus TaxID=2943436 RepID=UPI002445B816|nr:uncharacterized protein LOC129601775 isoform X2 [Paramacrobiotus metropolitanus]